MNQFLPIGIAVFTTYTSCMGLGTSFRPPEEETIGGPGFNARDFHPFYRIDDQIENNIKVNGCWLKNFQIFLFEGKTSDELILYKREMMDKYQIQGFTDIHRLYERGLHLDAWGNNIFHDKKLERKINKER